LTSFLSISPPKDSLRDASQAEAIEHTSSTKLVRSKVSARDTIQSYCKEQNNKVIALMHTLKLFNVCIIVNYLFLFTHPLRLIGVTFVLKVASPQYKNILSPTDERKKGVRYRSIPTKMIVSNKQGITTNCVGIASPFTKKDKFDYII